MARRADRCINSKMTTGHDDLESVSIQADTYPHRRKYTGRMVYIVDEAYTNKTCGRCGALHAKLGGSKVFCCAQGPSDLVCERDVNGP